MFTFIALLICCHVYCHVYVYQPQARPGALLGCLSSTLLVPEILLGHRPTAPLISGVLLGWHTQPAALLIVWGFAEPAHTKGESMQEMYFLFFLTVATTPGHEPQPSQHTSPPGWTPGSYRLHHNVQSSLPSSTYLYGTHPGRSWFCQPSAMQPPHG